MDGAALARRWRGAWRAAALLPLAGLLFAVMRSAAGLETDRAARGLFPFEILLASLGAIVAAALLRLLRALVDAGRAQRPCPSR